LSIRSGAAEFLLKRAQCGLINEGAGERWADQQARPTGAALFDEHYVPADVEVVTLVPCQAVQGAPDYCCMSARPKTTVIVTAGMAAAEVLYAPWVRPRLMRWGATDEEVTGAYPGADLVPHGQRAATMAVTINAPPDQVWPWLVQMGGDRGGLSVPYRNGPFGRRQVTYGPAPAIAGGRSCN
jgi:hypothetical protein